MKYYEIVVTGDRYSIFSLNADEILPTFVSETKQKHTAEAMIKVFNDGILLTKEDFANEVMKRIGDSMI